MPVKQIQQNILKLKKEKDVTILAHYYQSIEIQEIADYLGDSLGLSRIVRDKVTSEFVIFAGVLFMAETASILNQDKHILMPNKDAGCPLADFLTPDIVNQFKKQYPGLPVVTYVNSTAAVKAVSDISCTSSNAVNIVNKISHEFNVKKVLFGPDSNLADYTEQKSNIEIIKMPENGHCFVHSRITPKDLNKSRNLHPDAFVLVHPECTREVRDLADFAGSTAQMYNRVKNSHPDEIKFIIGTECGMMERMAIDFPNKKFFLIRDKLTCFNMKKNELTQIEYLLNNLDDERHEVIVPSRIAERALKPINKMLNYS
jgi:quinolinate synthase